jgi:hypothetical protein
MGQKALIAARVIPAARRVLLLMLQHDDVHALAQIGDEAVLTELLHQGRGAHELALGHFDEGSPMAQREQEALVDHLDIMIAALRAPVSPFHDR